MAYCNYKHTDKLLYLNAAKEFLKTDYKSWDLISLQQIHNAGNTLEDIPFRSNECSRSKKCCGVCTRKCRTRCLQDCLHRLHMWRMLCESSTPEDRLKLPLGIQMIWQMNFEYPGDLSWCVGEIVSRVSNTAVRNYMELANLRPQENPYKIDYAPQVAIDPATGKRMCNPDNGVLVFLNWPQTGLCPYCVPKSTIDRRYGKDVKYE